MTKGQSHLLSSFDSLYAAAVLHTAFSLCTWCCVLFYAAGFLEGLEETTPGLSLARLKRYMLAKWSRFVYWGCNTLFSTFLFFLALALYPFPPPDTHWQSTTQKCHAENFKKLFPSQQLKIWATYNIKTVLYLQRQRNKQNCKELFLAKFWSISGHLSPGH